MKKCPFLLPAFCGFLLCCFSHLSWAERHETVILSYDKSETFPAISGIAWELPGGDVDSSHQLRWLLQNHAAVTKEIFLKQGETAYPVKWSSRLKTGHESSVNSTFYGPSLAAMVIEREGFDFNETVEFPYGGLYRDGGNVWQSPNFTSSYYSSNGKARVATSWSFGEFSSNIVHGPCKITIYLIPAVLRSKTSYKNRHNQTVTAQNAASLVKGLGGFEYLPSEGYVVFNISGSPSDTSVGATVGGSGSGGAVSGKNYVTVIPENSPKNVRIVLEQSTDLINWSAANQGVFSPSTTRRFFRVRSEEE